MFRVGVPDRHSAASDRLSDQLEPCRACSQREFLLRKLVSLKNTDGPLVSAILSTYGLSLEQPPFCASGPLSVAATASVRIGMRGVRKRSSSRIYAGSFPERVKQPAPPSLRLSIIVEQCPWSGSL
jgi:hypothetical protein